MVCLDRPCQFKLFKGCLPQILLGPFLNNLGPNEKTYYTDKIVITRVKLFTWFQRPLMH